MLPELPEVETVRQTLRTKILDKSIKAVDILYEPIIKTDLSHFKQTIINQTINEIERRGKYILIKLDDHYLISHLRMEGKYYIRNSLHETSKHEHVIFHLDDGTQLRYHDVRKFGTMHLKSLEEVHIGEPLEKLGYEPHDELLTFSYLKPKLKKSKRPIKTALLDQTIIAGLGNIYVDEVIFLSKLHPEQSADSLSDRDIKQIIQASKQVIIKAIKLGGTTIRSYTSEEGVHGRFQNELTVHMRKDEPCITCKETIIKMKVGGRGTYICPNCQKIKKKRNRKTSTKRTEHE
ncbi:DNA-formamidopyrimidine glycosylase [Haloplasma contractile]|uniref:Formamidopyrimidine-DNA glycosylase n=1 Tax=Haloplasma contractile SSD-17B TaxID=1033810 RepID=U2E9I3_9MOLU|nr:DNA-formamidopyrimidine glycosylase [Haloplasma contractile]ERJ11501.1 Formamidopyrimidine-DNA glycosylase protein [Haloplasma contractile SSD-17B]